MSPIGVAEWISGAYEYRRAVTVTPGCLAYWPNVTPSPGTEQSVMAGGPPMQLLGPAAVSTPLIPDEAKCLQYANRTDTYGAASGIPTSQAMTYEAWLQMEAVPFPAGSIYAFVSNSLNLPGLYLLPVADGGSNIYIVGRSIKADGNIVDVYDPTPRKATNLHHAVVTQEAGGKQSLYVNGDLMNSQATSGAVWNTNAGTTYPAFRTDQQNAAGRMGHFAVYSRALTAAEVRWHYRVGADLEKLPSYATVETLKAAPSAPAGVTGSVTDESGTTTQLAPLIRDGVVSGSPSFKARLKETGLFVAA